MTEEQKEARRKRCAELGKRTAATNAKKGAAKASIARTRHGHASRKAASAEYHAWESLVQRCTNPKNPRWKNYGARGITVDPSWVGPGGFDRFLAHVGRRPSTDLSIDRKNNDGNYEPGNVRWATSAEQHASQRYGRRS